MKANGFGRVMVGDKQVAEDRGGVGMGQVHLDKGEKVRINVVYAQFGEAEGSGPAAQLIWAKVQSGADPAALDAARKADVVIAVVGITSQLEGEEMPVNEPGFLGGDRTSINLPEPEEDLVRSAKAGKPLVVVLMNGSALAVNWEKEHANAILEAWYSGEEGGTAIAETLSGKNNPAGRLPVTFYKDINQLAQLRRLFDEQSHLPLFQGPAALSLRLWPQLHHVCLQGPGASHRSRGRGQPHVCRSHRHQHRQGGRR